jgi:hypothetical protein
MAFSAVSKSSQKRHGEYLPTSKQSGRKYRGTGMAIGNILRHDYDEIVDRILYDTAIHDLEPLKIAIRAMLAELNEAQD